MHKGCHRLPSHAAPGWSWASTASPPPTWNPVTTTKQDISRKWQVHWRELSAAQPAGAKHQHTERQPSLLHTTTGAKVKQTPTGGESDSSSALLIQIRWRWKSCFHCLTDFTVTGRARKTAQQQNKTTEHREHAEKQSHKTAQHTKKQTVKTWNCCSSSSVSHSSASALVQTHVFDSVLKQQCSFVTVKATFLWSSEWEPTAGRTVGGRRLADTELWCHTCRKWHHRILQKTWSA